MLDQAISQLEKTQTIVDDLQQNKLDLNNNQRIKQILGNAESMGIMYAPSMNTLNRAFDRGLASGQTLSQYIKNIHLLDKRWGDILAKRAARYKSEMLLDPDQNLGSLLVQVSDNQKVGYLEDINTYANNRAVIETITDFLIESGKVDGSVDSEYLVDPIVDRDEFLLSLHRKAGQSLYKSDLVINKDGSNKGITVAKGRGTKYPVYSLKSFAEWCATNGVVINGNKVELKKSIAPSDLMRLETELLPDINQ